MIIKRDTLLGKTDKMAEKGMCSPLFWNTFWTLRKFLKIHNLQKVTIFSSAT